MLRFIARRLLETIPVLLIIITATFFMIRFVPGAERLAQLVCVDAAKLANHRWLYYRLGELGLDRLSTEGAAERNKAVAPDIAAPLIAAVVKTTGIRKAYKVFGLIEYFSGRLFHQGVDGRFNGVTYVAFLETVLTQTTAPLFLVQDGAPYHRSAPVKAFFAQHADRLHVTQLPSYSPDYNPIEFLWRAIKRTATHNRYFPEFAHLIASVEEALTTFQRQPERVKALFGRYLDEPMTDSIKVANAVAA